MEEKDEMIGKVITDYTITRKIASGSFGDVYRVEKNDGQRQALKRIFKSKINTDELKRGLKEEVRVMGMFDHPNLLKCIDCFETETSYYLILPICNNGSLRNYLGKRGVEYLPESSAVSILRELACGFKELHKQKVMHRDFKVDNVFVNNDRVLIGDFGCVSTGMKRADEDVGTGHYKAPEILDKKPYSNQVDLWALGLTFYELLYADYPFGLCFNEVDVRRAQKTKSGENLKFPTFNKVSDECKNLLRAMLTEDPEKRLRWKELFHHKLFDQTIQKEIDEAPEYIQKACLTTIQILLKNTLEKNKNDVFQKSKLDPQDTFYDNEISKPDQEPQWKQVIATNVDQDRQQLIQGDNNDVIFAKRIEKIYLHEQSRIIFIGAASLKLMDQAEQIPNHPYINLVAIAFAFMAKKSAQYFRTMMNSLNERRNLFNLEHFVEWTNHRRFQDYQQNITLEYDMANTQRYQLVYPRLSKYNFAPFEHNLLLALGDDNLEVPAIQEILTSKLNEMNQYICQDYYIQSNTEVFKGVLYAYVYLRFAIDDMQHIPFAAVETFDWKNFYKRLDWADLDQLRALAGI